ncbi:phospholipase D family protein [Ideonella sp. DXS22W]|uniref:Phospholipase D family protein n=1 Tax=Pseudaquabacterium inlustre TaxID=2984192 RepID=A0ABU9CIM5_9BURK
MLLSTGLLAGLGGCAALPTPERAPGPPARFITAVDDAPLSRVAAASGAPAGGSAFRPMLLSSVALQARLSLIARAQSGIDIQTYLLGDDATGHQLLRALSEAAARGVRVRLLVDDLYTAGLTDLLLGLAAQPNVEVRLYNPFPAGRDSWLLRGFSLVSDFGRLNRRMHNKLFIADGRLAVVGGRNLADAYFMRSDEGNFIDFDLLCAGAVVPELATHFDDFWNSRFAVPVQQLADNTLDTDARRASVEALTRPGLAPLRAVPAGQAASWSLGRAPWVVAERAQVFFDSPDKTAARGTPTPTLPVAQLLATAQRKVDIVTPYFLPSAAGLDGMRRARERGVEVQVTTNSLVDSDEPLVSVAYGRHRLALLQSGVRLFELSSERLKRHAPLREVLANSVGRLHAKLGFIDERLLLVGSMNLDPRSAGTNTELMLLVDSAELVRQVQQQLQPAEPSGLFEVRLAADGQSLEWLGRDAAAGVDERLREEPTPPWWQRLKLWLLYQLVPDDLL